MGLPRAQCARCLWFSCRMLTAQSPRKADDTPGRVNGPADNDPLPPPRACTGAWHASRCPVPFTPGICTYQPSPAARTAALHGLAASAPLYSPPLRAPSQSRRVTRPTTDRISWPPYPSHSCESGDSALGAGGRKRSRSRAPLVSVEPSLCCLSPFGASVERSDHGHPFDCPQLSSFRLRMRRGA